MWDFLNVCLDLMLKKKRTSDEEVGFAEGYNGHFSGIHMNIGDNHNNPLPNIGGSEVKSIHSIFFFLFF